MKITKSELLEMIKEQALNFKKEYLGEQIEKVEEPYKVDMQKFDSEKSSSHSKKALTYKNLEKTEEKAGPQTKELGGYDEKAVGSINSQDKDQGQDEDIATAVAVEAGKEKKGDNYLAGQKTADFTSKKDNPKKEVSQPFDEKAFDGKMNKEDKEGQKGTKTFVEAGAKKGGDTWTAGQAKAEAKERAPEVKDKEPIAKGIEIKGSNVKNIKESYTKSELVAFIKEEAQKMIKKEMLMEEIAKINKELNEIK